MANRRMRKRALFTSGALVAVAAIAVGTFLAGGASAGSPPFVVGGTQISHDHFSFSTLQSHTIRAHVESTRAKRVDACMSARGLAKPPVDNPVKPEEVQYAAAFAAASIGDDITSNDMPNPTTVKLPDGSTYEIAVTWTPATCTYQAYESLGGDPFMREALRQSIMIFEAQAHRVIESKVDRQRPDGRSVSEPRS